VDAPQPAAGAPPVEKRFSAWARLRDWLERRPLPLWLVLLALYFALFVPGYFLLQLAVADFAASHAARDFDTAFRLRNALAALTIFLNGTVLLSAVLRLAGLRRTVPMTLLAAGLGLLMGLIPIVPYAVWRLTRG